MCALPLQICFVIAGVCDNRQSTPFKHMGVGRGKFVPRNLNALRALPSSGRGGNAARTSVLVTQFLIPSYLLPNFRKLVCELRNSCSAGVRAPSCSQALDLALDGCPCGAGVPLPNL